MEQRLASTGVDAQDVKSFLEAGHAYEQAMCDVQVKLGQYLRPLPAIANNVSERAVRLQEFGKETERTFFSLDQSVLGLPIVENELWSLFITARVLENTGDRMNALAGEINARADENQRTLDDLDQRLTIVGTQINKFQAP